MAATSLNGERPVCLLTGASGRFGTAFSRMYASRYDIGGVYHRHELSVPTRNQRCIDPLRPNGGRKRNAHPLFDICADLTRPGEIERVVELTLARYGRIDILINAAAHSVWAPMLGSDRLDESLERQFLLNVIAPLRLARRIADEYWRGRRDENEQVQRSVINVSSTAGLYVYPGSGQSAYSASKAALNHMTWHMALEFSDIGIRVNAVAPNSFPKIVPTRRVCQAVRDLVEGDLTGKIVVVDRGGDRVL